jgi:pimeloyl-ACP methyl ester carboxylesterase
VVEASGAKEVIPVAVSHAGWIAIELRRRLGERVPQLVLLDWLVLDPPPQFLDVLKGLQTDRWRETRDMLFNMWLAGVDSEPVIRFIRDDMGSFGAETWKRAGREIGNAYAKFGNPLQALATLYPPGPTLHLYAQEGGPAYDSGQQSFANSHPWFQSQRLNARSHFPMLEVPDVVARAIDRFISEGQKPRSAVQAPQAPA